MRIMILCLISRFKNETMYIGYFNQIKSSYKEKCKEGMLQILDNWLILN